MSHKTIQEQLIFFLEGSLPDEQMKQVAAHLESCGSCRRLFQELKADMALLEDDRNLPFDPYFYAKVKHKISSTRELPVWQSKRVLQPAFFLLVLALGIQFGIWVGGHYDSPRQTVSQEAALFPLNDLSHEPIELFLLNLE
ncbi:anti-sigma factor family protein [Gaoshiqia sediminis]|uniref:Zf-HC2 domain-containing protein n=1 Tax=Gaoshiqia sediminis TaxID=2986998 RepID=A0AA41Y6T3_9BACT|nr:zf-HC2 domain-containing protein [Gaoshiqia sediminis]MCW0482167.1 zf-HC2 domain-containing protein [Gaoshiqia sediminis]